MKVPRRDGVDYILESRRKALRSHATMRTLVAELPKGPCILQAVSSQGISNDPCWLIAIVTGSLGSNLSITCEHRKWDTS